MVRRLFALATRQHATVIEPVLTDADVRALRDRNTARLAEAKRRMARARSVAVEWPQPGIHWSLQHPNQ